MPLHTIKSPVLQQMGCGQNGFEQNGNTIPTAGEFQIQKELWQQDKSKDKSGKEILPGFMGRNYD